MVRLIQFEANYGLAVRTGTQLLFWSKYKALSQYYWLVLDSSKTV